MSDTQINLEALALRAFYVAREAHNINKLEAILDEVVEHCAKVAEEFGSRGLVPRHIAAKIRESRKA